MTEVFIDIKTLISSLIILFDLSPQFEWLIEKYVRFLLPFKITPIESNHFFAPKTEHGKLLAQGKVLKVKLCRVDQLVVKTTSPK